MLWLLLNHEGVGRPGQDGRAMRPKPSVPNKVGILDVTASWLK